MKYAAFLLFSIVLTGCTVSADRVTSRTIGYSGSTQNAGILGWVLDAQGNRIGATVNAEYHLNYFRMVNDIGYKTVPPVSNMDGFTYTGDFKGHDTWTVDMEHVGIMAQMVQLTINP